MKNVTPTTTPEPQYHLITLAGLEAAQLSPTAQAIARRDELLALCRRGTSIPNAESAQRAGNLLKEVKGFTALIEATRKSVKAPVLKLGQDIDALAANLTKELEAETNRIGGLVANFQAEERRKEEEARRRAAEEQARILKEQQERERKAREEAEAAELAKREAEEKARREAAELEAKASRARSEARRAELEAEAKKKAEEAAAAAAKAEAEAKARAEKLAQEQVEAAKALAATNTAVSLASAPKLEGLALRQEIKFEVTNIHELFEALPGMVILTPNNAAIKAHLKTLPEGQRLPGVRHWKEAKTSVR
jgi:DNA repair exonuclease SbcCD ATPase subunit